MELTHERQRGLDAGRRWARVASSYERATVMSGSYYDLCRIMPPDVSNHFIAGFREGSSAPGTEREGLSTKPNGFVRLEHDGRTVHRICESRTKGRSGH
ncbi:hypothetical protein CT676_41475 [Bradyrhizobium sp. MOS001]|uniref:hypothetical protein n=1 Tax=unclassified Bradyrhizobium TaxID=2631580 RepID=UPI0010754001|nr:hypothetical protein [Bradyrhizobium sp. MOS001]TFW53496.1 hypothetical protein CT676_41475 [Bradyrhizobium sp. MOS001]